MFEKMNIIGLEEVDNYQNPKVIAHFVSPIGEWFIVAGDKQDNNDWLLFGIGDIIEKEMGFMTLSQITEMGGVLDTDWKPIGMYEVL